MTATERLAKNLGYIQYNYPRNSPIRIAAEAGNINAFRLAARHITEMMDIGVVEIVDARD